MTFFFDVGSASGFYALVFARRGAARVLAAEPHPATCERLRRNLAANPEHDVEAVKPRRWIPEVRTLAFNRWCVARGA